MTLPFRALELHGRRMWDRVRIIEALDAIRRYRLTALVLHETDMLQHVLFPRAYFDPYAQWAGAPTRRGENAIQNNRVYLDHVIRLARARGVEIWLEVKELGFPDEVLELHPKLLKQGRVCPSEPFWQEFIEARTAELFADFPGLSGLIVSPGSPEGRAARAQNKCGCRLCADTPLALWYQRLIAALYRPAKAAGKRLAVREFAYTPEDQAPLLAALDALPEEIILCAKVTPHDFYPTFPDNPAIRPSRRPMWVEYDVHGQFYGWGLFPCLMADDIAARLTHAAAQGACGGLFRVEWERVNDLWGLETPNEMNLIAAAAVAAGETIDSEAITMRWLARKNYPATAAPAIAGLMELTWPVLRRALYVDGFVFADCSMFPRSIGRAWWTMEKKHSLAAWDPSRAGGLRLDRERVRALLAEKAAAIELAEDLVARLQAAAAAAPGPWWDELEARFALLPRYVRGMSRCAEVCLYARWAEQKSADGPTAAEFAGALDRLKAFEAEMAKLADDVSHPHQLIMLMDYRRIADVHREGLAVFDRYRASPP
jgi:hypothetical protein